MSKSWKRAQREQLGKGSPATEREYDLLIVLADLVEATPSGQRTTAMTGLLNEVRNVQLAHPKKRGAA